MANEGYDVDSRVWAFDWATGELLLDEPFEEHHKLLRSGVIMTDRETGDRVKIMVSSMDLLPDQRPVVIFGTPIER